MINAPFFSGFALLLPRPCLENTKADLQSQEENEKKVKKDSPCFFIG
jgi:hypothetical protein